MDLQYPNDDFSSLLDNSGELFLKYLFDKYYLEFCRLSYRYVSRIDIAEDIVQDVFINIWNKRFSLNCKGNVKPYFIRSIINSSINYIQSKQARQNIVGEDFALNTHSDHSSGDELAHNELNNLINVAIEELPDKCRTIFKLSRFSDYSNKEIAENLNISVKTVEAQISIALKKIQHFISKYGFLSLCSSFILIYIIGY
jgi:RNA polymerase sigma-70 factor (ECF subfamily)